MQKFLLGMIFVILAWGYFEWFRDNTLLNNDMSAKTTLVLPDIILPSSTPLAISDFKATLSRPIFFAKRKLPIADIQPLIPKAISTPKFTTKPPNIRLTAILSDSQGKRFALLASNQGEDRQLILGDMFDGWRLSKMSDDSVTLVANQQSHVLNLYDFSIKHPEKSVPVWHKR